MLRDRAFKTTETTGFGERQVFTEKRNFHQQLNKTAKCERKYKQEKEAFDRVKGI